MFYPGDIVGVEGNMILKCLNALVAPYNDRGHFLLLGEYLDDGDWAIYESRISRGVRIGRLSWYEGKHIEIGRVDEDIGAAVIKGMAKYSGFPYDHLSLIRLAWAGICNILIHGQPIPYKKLSTEPDKSFMCTELVTETYKKHYQLIPDNVASTAAAINQAYKQGLIKRIWAGELTCKGIGR